MDTIFAQNLVKETRAILNGCYSFAGQVGILVYSIVAGKIFDTIGPKSPFELIGVLDLAYASIIVLSSLFGAFDQHDDKSRKSIARDSIGKQIGTS